MVREARAAEPLELLDGQQLELKPDTLVIADQAGPLAIAGIMGGQASAVSESTTNILLEAAFFTPDLLSGKARVLRPAHGVVAPFRAGCGFRAAAGGHGTGQPVVAVHRGWRGRANRAGRVSRAPAPAAAVTLRADRIVKMLGLELPPAEVERILSGLGLGVTATDGGWTCSVPSWRFDIAIEADLLEELARVYGYNRVPATPIHADLVMPSRPETGLSIRQLRRHLSARGFREAITYSFVDPKLQKLFDPETAPVALTNPISADMAVMRTSLLPGLVAAVMRNANRQQPRTRLFETGLRFLPGEQGLRQVPTLAMVATGPRFPESWSVAAQAADFFDLKGDVESVFALARDPGSVGFGAAQRAALHPGQTAQITRKGQVVGYLGALHPTVQAQLDLGAALFVCEIELDSVLEGVVPRFAELSKFPEVRRDIAVVVDKSVPSADLMANVRTVAGSYLTDLRLFDVYDGKGIDPKRKSLALGLTFRDHSRTLSDDDVNLAVDQVIDSLEKNFKAELRN